LLYRGINKADDEKNGGKLIPKGKATKVVPLLDGRWKFDGKFRYGPCQTNTARAQQIDSGLYGGSGISTSRSETVAVKFATSGFIEEGFVYVIDENLLESLGVTAHEFDDPVEPHEREVTLIEKSGSALPCEAIVGKYAVNSDGKRI
jgi:hypothetical protein